MNSPGSFEQEPASPEPHGSRIDEAIETAQETISSAGSTLLQWVRENPATAIAGIFASGLAVGYALAMGTKHEPTFRERFSEEPLDAIRDAVQAAVAPVGARLMEALGTARSMGAKAADNLNDHAGSAASWAKKFRRAGDNLKFW